MSNEVSESVLRVKIRNQVKPQGLDQSENLGFHKEAKGTKGQERKRNRKRIENAELSKAVKKSAREDKRQFIEEPPGRKSSRL